LRRKIIVGITLTLLILSMLTFAFDVQPIKAQSVHDIAIVEIVLAKPKVTQGYPLSIEVTVENEGDFSETFNVIVYYDNTTIETKVVTSLPSGVETTLTFLWDTTAVALGNYTIRAYAPPVVGETDTVDNHYFDGIVQVVSLIIVPDHYSTIQGAINKATPWDTIFVRSGTYYENVVVNKTLTLNGESRSNTIINGSGLSYTGALVTIVVDNVDMSEFTVTNALHQGIEVGDSGYCEVHDNVVCFTGDRGIVFGGGDNNKAYNNVVHNSSAYGGIEAIWSSNNTIYNNIAYFNQWGIATNHGSYNHIYNNKVHSNRGAGIHVDWPSTDNIIYNNDISSNTNTGIRVINQANRTEIFGNKISENFCGIQLENSFANNISGNYIVNNAAAVTLVSSENNTVYHNNFIGNGWQVYVQPSRFNIWDDGYPSGGNYWSDHTGLDLYSGLYQDETGSDGIGDVPYTIDANNTDRYPLMRTHYYEDRMTQVVSTESTDNSHYASLAVDSSGNVHIAWHDLTDYAGCGNDLDIFYKRFEVGVGWTSTEVVSTESTGLSAYPSLAVDSSGNIHVVWDDNTDLECGSDRDIFYKRFEVGVGWTSTEVVSTESTGLSAYPSLAVDSSGNIHVTWHDNTTDYADSGTDLDIFYKRFEVGVGWTSTEVVSTESTGESRYPCLAVDLAGNVHIAWADYTEYAGCGSDPDIFYKYVRVHSTQYPWSMFRHNPRHTGYTESPAPNTNQTQWTYTTSGNVYSSPAVVDGMVFVGSNDGNVYALDQHTGAHIWNYSTGNAVMSSPAVVDGKVYVGSNDSKVYALDQYTGAHVWNYTTGDWITSSPTVADGKVFVGSFDAKVYCLDAATGAHIWNYSTGGLGWSSPAVVDGKVYIGSGDGNVYCLDVVTGAHVWNYTTGDWITSSPAVADGKVYVGSNDGNVYALDQHTGAHIWNYTTGNRVYSSPAVADGKVYVGSRDNKTYCLDASTGAFIWTYTTSNLVSSSPAVADGKVYVGSKDNKVYCLDAATGAHIWNYSTGDCVESSPAVVDGMVFVGSYDGVVYAFGNVIRVPEDYPTIQEAIDVADLGATIIVAPGVYHESMVINKSLSIIGEEGSGPIHEGGGSGIGWNLTDTSEVTIVNFVITNWDQGMLIVNSSNCKIYGNIFEENNVAINLTETSIINTIYWNSFINNNVQVITETSMNIWDNDYPDGGNYWSTYISEDICSGPDQNEPGSDGIFDTNYTIVPNNIDRYPLVKPFSPHDVGITSITTSKTVVCQGYELGITEKILNYGINTETFTITVYVHTTVIIQTQTTLTSRKSTTITLTWNTTGVAKGNYAISVYAWPVPGETDTADNAFIDGTVYVGIVGDVNADGKVDMKDIGICCLAYGSTPGHPRWNPNADINDDDKVDMKDIGLACMHYGETDP